MVKLRLFKIVGPAWKLEELVELSGWSHRNNVREEKICAYPWREQVADFYAYSPNTRTLMRELTRVCVNPNTLRIYPVS